MEMEGQKFWVLNKTKEIRLFVTSPSFAFTLHQWVAETSCLFSSQIICPADVSPS